MLQNWYRKEIPHWKWRPAATSGLEQKRNRTSKKDDYFRQKACLTECHDRACGQSSHFLLLLFLLLVILLLLLRSILLLLLLLMLLRSHCFLAKTRHAHCLGANPGARLNRHPTKLSKTGEKRRKNEAIVLIMKGSASQPYKYIRSTKYVGTNMRQQRGGGYNVTVVLLFYMPFSQ